MTWKYVHIKNNKGRSHRFQASYNDGVLRCAPHVQNNLQEIRSSQNRSDRTRNKAKSVPLSFQSRQVMKRYQCLMLQQTFSVWRRLSFLPSAPPVQLLSDLLVPSPLPCQSIKSPFRSDAIYNIHRQCIHRISFNYSLFTFSFFTLCISPEHLTIFILFFFLCTFHSFISMWGCLKWRSDVFICL